MQWFRVSGKGQGLVQGLLQGLVKGLWSVQGLGQGLGQGLMVGADTQSIGARVKLSLNGLNSICQSHITPPSKTDEMEKGHIDFSLYFFMLT